MKPLAIIAALFLFALLCGIAAAHDHNPDHDEWYRSLVSPTTGISCCNTHDCKPTDARVKGGVWEAKTPEGTWIPVPPELIIHGKSNPTWRPVLCYQPHRGVICFVPGPEV